MHEFTVRTPTQLPALVQAFRKQAGLTQAATAVRLGITQQAFSALERNADKTSADRLIELFSVLGVEVVLRRPSELPAIGRQDSTDW